MPHEHRHRWQEEYQMGIRAIFSNSPQHPRSASSLPSASVEHKVESWRQGPSRSLVQVIANSHCGDTASLLQGQPLRGEGQKVHLGNKVLR